MGIPPSEALNLTLWQYEAILIEWNRAHDPDGDIDPVTPEDWVAMKQFFDDNPRFLQ